MGKTWMKLKKENTVKTKKSFYDPYDPEDSKTYKEKVYESCILCHGSECDLFGYYGTYNEFGSFRGICLDCFKKIESLIEENEE